MAENTKDEAIQEKAAETETPQQQDNLPANKVSVEDIGTLRKKVTVTIARERIEAKQEEMFGELAGTAQVPGFRIGRAPRRLIEKRFGKEVARDVRNALIGESIGDAVEKAELKTIGEPELDLEKIELPESGSLEFSFEAEVAPEFGLPELKGIKVSRPAMEITDQGVEEQIQKWARSEARYEKTDAAAESDDMVIAGAKITIEGIEKPLDRPGLSLRVAPGQIEGLPLIYLGDVLAGKKAGQTAELKIKVHQGHPNELWRGKEATIEIQVSQVRRRILPKVDGEFAKTAGFESVDDFRKALRRRMEAQMKVEITRAMQRQVEQYLIDGTKFDLPEALTQRHTTRVLQRRYVNLLEMGVPREQIDQNLTELQAAAGEQANRDLRVRFILGKVAEERQIEITPDEVNARVAQIASLYNRRPERLRQELAADGSLEQLKETLREEKVLDSLLADAVVTDAAPVESEKKAPKKAKTAAKKAEKEPAKKAPQKAEKATQQKAGPKKPSKKAQKKDQK